ncbi:unnamed protein product [Pleuronectes platessa]|uniref:G-protein coupled receptors family 3 profile domain-containing protein n=1 Tax=Pleuronectes platessa TaxID=8262 RepID=A0A9N7YCK8_PLEPL|nr:unnamed protein product [Pleuronectes platessa]
MRFAVEEINNGSSPQPLLPGVKLGYQMYDICSVPASVLATLDLLEQQNQSPSGPETQGDTDPHGDYSKRAVAVIGPDSSSKTFTPAALLGSYLIPQISYEASNEMLSNKFLYPSFLRTIPSDKNQVEAMIQLLIRFNWKWIALLGSDNDYGLQGMQSLSKEAPNHSICIAYQGVIPSFNDNTIQTMRNMVDSILKTKVNTIVVFSSKSKLSGFIPFVIERNVTGKVWIGTEDWSSATLISGISGINTIGTVIGVSIKYAAINGFEDFERKVFEAAMQQSDTQEVSNDTTSQGNDCLQSTDLYSLARKKFSLEKYDITSSFNVYTAVHAVAWALHQTLGCDLGECQRRRVHPWELLHWLKQVEFSLGNTSVHFDMNGDPHTEYDIVSWVWRGTEWSLRVVGSYSHDPFMLTVDEDQIEWHDTGHAGPVPLSICSPPCPTGHKKLLTGQHTCCFDCQACPAATFLNTSEPTLCQPCLPEQWAPPSSDQCLNRTVLLLAWDAPLSIALLFFLATCLLMTLGSAVVCIFKFASKLPPAYDKWAKKNGPELTIFVLSVTLLFICVLREALNLPQPSQDLVFYGDSIVLECSNTLSVGAGVELAYVFLLSMLCFCFSYMGKDLPANYNEAKCVTFSLMVYMISWQCFFTLYLISRGPFTMAAHVFAILFSVFSFLWGYFLPKIYIIALKPQMNTNAHFQNCIQMYTMSK